MNDLYNEDFLVCSASYREVINNDVLPWLKAKEKAVSVPGCDGHPLYCVSYEADNPLGTVMIVHGFTENAFKYAELIWSLLHLGFSVVAFDQRGHGRSWRDGDVHDQSVTHVDYFSEYVLDLRNVYLFPELLFSIMLCTSPSSATRTKTSSALVTAV